MKVAQRCGWSAAEGGRVKKSARGRKGKGEKGRERKRGQRPRRPLNKVKEGRRRGVKGKGVGYLNGVHEGLLDAVEDDDAECEED